MLSNRLADVVDSALCIDRKILSSLPLQQFLYYNLFYSPIWFVAVVVQILHKVHWAAFS